MKLLQVSLILCFLYQNVISYRILGVLPVPSKSHYYIGHNLLKGLAKEGHDVTVITPILDKNPIKNYKEVFLEHSWDNFRKISAKDNFVDFSNMHVWNMIFKYFDVGMDMTNWALESKNLQEFMKIKQHFDVVVVEVCVDEALLGFGNYYNAPVVAISAFGASKWTTDLVGSPNFASFRDQPRTPLETGMHWVKHVAKNKGAPHLRSVAVDLPFFKLYNLDVSAFIFGVIALTLFLL
ncbi:uncharacterized protein LOC116348206, partial [Contarinia nasturtii]|uniref:uncharacterized protein LOC116348206 n=1 Tax=Contarinia nasturtii TaxID=265458 RepID=UPI0012D4C37D